MSALFEAMKGACDPFPAAMRDLRDVVRDAQLRRDNVPDRESGRRSRVIGDARREIVRLRSQLHVYKELAESYRKAGNICWGCKEIITNPSDYHADMCWRCEREEFGH